MDQRLGRVLFGRDQGNDLGDGLLDRLPVPVRDGRAESMVGAARMGFAGNTEKNRQGAFEADCIHIGPRHGRLLKREVRIAELITVRRTSCQEKFLSGFNLHIHRNMPGSPLINTHRAGW